MFNLTLTDADNGKSLEVQQGAVIVVQLMENPTTGYRWTVDTTDAGILIEQNPETPVFIPAASQAPGAAGIRIFTFKAGKIGTTRIQLRLARPWEPGTSGIQHFNVGIRVSERRTSTGQKTTV